MRFPARTGSLHAKVSQRGLRFFAHDAAHRDCPLAGETIEHRLLKSALAAAVRLTGWHAALEATAPDRSWRADVMATSPDGARRAAWEAQLSRQHEDDTTARTARYAADGIEVIWVF
jgi:competence protein CoiA